VTQDIVIPYLGYMESPVMSDGYAYVAINGDGLENSVQGRVEVYDLNSSELVEVLMASDGFDEDFFGFGLDASGDTAIVGAEGQGSGPRGNAYLYRRSDGIAPVPLPAGVWLLASGLGLLALRRRRAN